MKYPLKLKAERLIIVLLVALLILVPLSACQPTNDDVTETGGIYRFEDYENDEIFDIVKLDLSDSYDEVCTSYKFTYLSDGYKIKGYISIPSAMAKSQEPGKCVLYNRGGNRDLGKLEDDSTAVICSMCGRIVIASQYRGGGGSEGSDEFGGDDLHDVIKLIDLCEDHFSFVSMDDFCVAGVSRGGMMTYMAARQDNRIKRIIAVSAVSDLVESYESREDMRDVMIETMGCTPQGNPAEYEKRSAICWADEIRIPVLIIHSKLDEQVSFSQAEAMYEKLKDTTDCTFITHDDNVHGIHHEDFQTILEWLDQH
ncbi:MAG: prolyl oligopeptidase family serine peptidase [Ruminococcus sp.]|nr:prolyl oligopeptidase family serine peptidase [Ruminococcus sp.]